MRIVKPTWIKHDTKGKSLSIFSLDIHPDGTKVATGGQGNDCGRVTIWNMAPIRSSEAELNRNVPKLFCQIDSHLQCVNAVRWSNSGSYLASAGDDQLIMIWTLSGRHSGPGPIEQYRTVSTLRSHSGDILDLSWSNDDQWLASCSVDNMIVVWNAQRWPEIITTLKGHSGLVKGVTWDPIGKYLASQSDDKSLRVWRVSDWSEETIITEPFEQCGGTTHVLRLSWSPDGQFLVSAQAMNNCGSVAKIIDRQDWQADKDFVGHRKAIPCVRFNPNMFKYQTQNKKKDDAKESKLKRQSVLAIGSRDRSISIWATARGSRPLIVCSDLFENSVLDFSWSKTGYQLMACSSDGSVVFLEFSEKELGPIYSEEERRQYLQQLYGNSVGNKSAIISNLIEDLDIMMLHKPKESGTTTNGIAKEAESGSLEKSIPNPPDMANSNSSSVTNSKSAQALRLAKGPTDKQIEIRSADGRRRIIPLFIPPLNDVSTVNNVNASISAAANLTSFSSSSEAKSKIVIETRDESNPPIEYMSYVSTSQLSNGTMNSSVQSSEAKKTETNGLGKPSESVESDKQQKSPKLTTAAATNATVPGATVTTNGILGHSKPTQSGKSDSSDESSNDEIIIRRQKSISTKRKSVDNGAPNANTIPVKRKPGRPPGSGTQQSNQTKHATEAHSKHNSHSKHNDQAETVQQHTKTTATTTATVSEVGPSSKVTASNSFSSSRVSNAASSKTVFFPPLKLSRQSQASVKLFTCSETSKIYTADVERPLNSSSFCKLSLCIDSQSNWNVLLSSYICALSANKHILVCVCEDGSMNIFNTQTGRRIYVPIMLESPVARMVCANKSHVLLITCNAHLWLWDVLLPRVLIKGESLLPLLIHPMTSEQLSILNATVSATDKPKPIVAVSNGRTYVYESDLSSWCLVADSSNPLNACTDLKPSAVTALRNASSLAKIPSRSLLNYFSSNTPMAQHGLISFIEQQIEASKVMASATEYRYWLITLVQNLVSLHSSGFNADNIETRLRELCNFLLGQQFPRLRSDTISGSTVSSTPILASRGRSFTGGATTNGSGLSSISNKILGISKHELLREVLSLLTSNLSLQRLYIEFKEQLESFSQSLTLNNTSYLNSTTSKAQAQMSDAQSLSCIN